MYLKMYSIVKMREFRNGRKPFEGAIHYLFVVGFETRALDILGACSLLSLVPDHLQS